MGYNTFEELYVEQLKDLHSAEVQLLEALPKMAQAASHSELKDAFNTHLEQTKTQHERFAQDPFGTRRRQRRPHLPGDERLD